MSNIYPRNVINNKKCSLHVKYSNTVIMVILLALLLQVANHSCRTNTNQMWEQFIFIKKQLTQILLNLQNNFSISLRNSIFTTDRIFLVSF